MWACIDLRPLKWSCYGNLYCCCHWWSVWQVSLQNIIFMLVAQGLWILIYRFFFSCDDALAYRTDGNLKGFMAKSAQSFPPILQIVWKVHLVVFSLAAQGSKSAFLQLAAICFFFQAGIESWWKRISQVSISERHSLSSSWMCSHSF